MTTTNLLNGRTINNNSQEVIEISSDDESIDNDEDDYILFCGNLNANVTKEILYELFLQGGPIEDIIIPKNSYSKCYAFIKFAQKCSVMYCLKLFEGVKLFGQEIILNKRSNKINQRILPTVVTATASTITTAAPSRISTLTTPSGIPSVMVPSRIPVTAPSGIIRSGIPPPGITRPGIPPLGITRPGIPPQGIPSPIMTPSTSMLSFLSQPYHESLSAFYSESRRISFMDQFQHNLNVPNNLHDSNTPPIFDVMSYQGGNFEALMHFYSML